MFLNFGDLATCTYSLNTINLVLNIKIIIDTAKPVYSGHLDKTVLIKVSFHVYQTYNSFCASVLHVVLT